MKRLIISVLVAILVVSVIGLVPVSADSTYRVSPGDTLTRIAVRYGISVYQLACANGLNTSSWVYVGQRLVIPGPGAPVLPRGGGYIVRPGDTLTNIAARYGISVYQLARANGLSYASWVYVGQRLAIPRSV